MAKYSGYHYVDTPAVDANTRVMSFSATTGVVCVDGRACAGTGVYPTNIAVSIRQSGPFTAAELAAGPDLLSTYYPRPMPTTASYRIPQVGALHGSPYAQNYIAVWTKYGNGPWGQPVDHGFKGITATSTECPLVGPLKRKKPKPKPAAVKKKKSPGKK